MTHQLTHRSLDAAELRLLLPPLTVLLCNPEVTALFVPTAFEQAYHQERWPLTMALPLARIYHLQPRVTFTREDEA